MFKEKMMNTLIEQTSTPITLKLEWSTQYYHTDRQCKHV